MWHLYKQSENILVHEKQAAEQQTSQMAEFFEKLSRFENGSIERGPGFWQEGCYCTAKSEVISTFVGAPSSGTT